MSVFIMWLHRPLMCLSKRQSFTARISTEVEIYATVKCTKNILHPMNIISDINFLDESIKGPVRIWNDNKTCVCWSKNSIMKGLCPNKGGVEMGLFKIINGRKNPSDIFTKEGKDTGHFVKICDSISACVMIDSKTI